MSSQASNFKRRPSSRSAPRPSTTSSTGTVAKSESTAATSAVITFTKKMGPGVPWVPWITGLQEACRAANFHVVANTIQSLEQPPFGKQGLENLQTQINKLQSEQKTVLGRITRFEKEPPWSEAAIQKTYKEHIVVLYSIHNLIRFGLMVSSQISPPSKIWRACSKNTICILENPLLLRKMSGTKSWNYWMSMTCFTKPISLNTGLTKLPDGTSRSFHFAPKKSRCQPG